MAIAPQIQIPGYAAPRDLDFSPLAKLAEQWKANQQQQVQQEALAAYAGGDPSALLRSGNMSLAQLYVQDQQRKQDLERQSRLDTRQIERDKVLDARADRQMAQTAAYQNASLGLQRRAQDRLDDPTPDNFVADPNAPGGYRPIGPADPAYIAQVSQAKGENAAGKSALEVEGRKRAAAQAGLDPSHPAYQGFVLTGKMPREDAQPLTATDKKAILEADEGVMTAKSAIDALRQAKSLSGQAFQGPTAGMRGYAASFLGQGSDTGKAGLATLDLENTVTSNALTQLKAIFGGAPTEGERKILLDIQGSARLPHAARMAIYDRAEKLAERRLQFNQQRADEMRGGNFYKPTGSMSRAPVQQTQGITQEQYNALPSGSVFTAPDGTQRVKP